MELESLQFSLLLIKKIDGYSDIFESSIYQFEIGLFRGRKTRKYKSKYITKINGFFINDIIFDDKEFSTSFLLFGTYDEYKITKIKIDTFTNVTPEIENKVDETINYLLTTGLFSRYEEPIFEEISTRKNFRNIYDEIKDLRLGSCVGKSEKFNPFIRRIVELYNINNVDLIYFKNTKSVYSFITKGKRKYGNDEAVNFYSTFFAKNNSLFIPDDFIFVFNNSEKQMIIIPLIISIEGDDNHQNVLLFDKSTMEFERFEPNGSYMIELDTDIENKMKILLPEFSYIKPSSYCPIEGPQIIIGSDGCFNGGFCVTISILYSYLRIRNPEYTRDEIILVLNSYNPFLLRKFNTYIDMLIPDINDPDLKFIS